MCRKHPCLIFFTDTEDLGKIVQLSLAEIVGWQVCLMNLDTEDLEMVKTLKPDLILLDTVLPNMDELAILRKIQNDPATKNIPIVLLTERMLQRDRKLYKSLQVLFAVTKPFDAITLVEKIKKKLNWN